MDIVVTNSRVTQDSLKHIIFVAKVVVLFNRIGVATLAIGGLGLLFAKLKYNNEGRGGFPFRELSFVVVLLSTCSFTFSSVFASAITPHFVAILEKMKV